MNITSPTHFGTLKVHGLDATAFLQGQLTSDIHLLTTGAHQLTAFCNRQGRVLALMDIFRLNEDYFLTLPQELLPIIQKELQKYIVSSKVKIDDYSHEYTLTVSQDFRLSQMKALIPFIGLDQTAQFLPHPLGLVKLGAVSFNKGCFVGQEIIARMQHRATLTKELQYLEVSEDALPALQETQTMVNTLKINPQTYAVLVITDTKMLYTTSD
ncbi:MAG: hypothetical protein WC748_07735 [Legionellales bacterium]|jgi:hypothetical protein